MTSSRVPLRAMGHCAPGSTLVAMLSRAHLFSHSACSERGAGAPRPRQSRLLPFCTLHCAKRLASNSNTCPSKGSRWTTETEHHRHRQSDPPTPSATAQPASFPRLIAPLLPPTDLCFSQAYTFCCMFSILPSPFSGLSIPTFV